MHGSDKEQQTQSNKIKQSTQESKAEIKYAEPRQSFKFSPPVIFSRPLTTYSANNKKVKVALYFPFSGKSKELGWSLYNAAVLSLFDNDVNHSLELVLVDSADSPFESAKSIKEITDQDIKIVIGPVFGNSVEAMDKNFMNNSITAISLTNNQDLSGKINNNGGVFVAGFLPEQQIDKIVTYAIDHEKINFSILAPNNQYGMTIAAMLKRLVRLRDGRMITSEFHDPNGADLNKSVERLVNAFTSPKHLSEGGGNKIDKNKKIKESDRTYAQVILIAESGKNLQKITQLIKDFNVDEREYQLVGTGQWDDISTLNDPNLIGAWFAAPIHERFAGFEKAYYQTYNKFPPRIASIVYDSVAAVAELVDKRGGQTPDIKDFITFSDSTKNIPSTKNGFEGIDGTFRFLANGLVQRNLAVLQVGKGSFETLDKPAEKFLKF